MLILAYALLGTLLLLALLRSPIHWAIKAGLIVASGVFYIGHFQSIESIRGWPSHQSPPDEFQLLSTEVIEPNKNLGTEGAIYLWGIPDTGKEQTPRAYRLPYSPPMHEGAEQAETMMEAGKEVMVRREEPETESAASSAGGDGTRYVFVEKPRRQLPPK